MTAPGVAASTIQQPQVVDTGWQFSWLARVLLLKIVVTLAWIIGCCLPVSLLAEYNVPVTDPPILLRLLAVAYAGLELGYVIGLLQTVTGEKSPATVGAGIVSNGGSLVVLLYFGLNQAWAKWRYPAGELMWLSAAALVIITTGLIVCGGPQLMAEWRRLRDRARSHSSAPLRQRS
jgi:hypothetical protein